MQTINIIHYFYPGTDPWKNIMELPEKEAFRKAAELAAAHPDTTSFGRFADFENYYPDRKKADEYVREAFIRLGGKPKLLHPYSFTLDECEYLHKWFSEGEKLVLDLSDIPDDQISFTIGDSCAQIANGMKPEVLTKEMLMNRIAECGNSVEAFLKASLGKFAYVEVQLWYRPMETFMPEIREAETDDAEEMISYLNIVGGESDNLMHGSEGFKAPVEAVKRRIQASHDSDNSVILIALAGEKIIARAELAGYPGARLHHNATFSISVRKDYWNMKIGTMLMTEIIERAKKMNLRNIELEVVADNKAAIALYRKMGFSDVGVYKKYWFANEVYSDAIVMQKCLDD